VVALRANHVKVVKVRLILTATKVKPAESSFRQYITHKIYIIGAEGLRMSVLRK